MDIALPDGSGDETYLIALDRALEYLDHQKVQFLVYLAGADPFYKDRLGRLKLSEEGIALRDQRVIDYVRERKIPLAMAMAGGYSNPIEETVKIHRKSIMIALNYQNAIASLRT